MPPISSSSDSLAPRQGHYGVPTVAFAPLVDATSCSGPVNIVLFHSGIFRNIDRRISIIISSTSLINPPLQLTIAQDVDVRDQHVVTWPQVTLPVGQYVLSGSATSELSRTVFIPSTFFAVQEGPDASCLDVSSSSSGTTPIIPSLTPSSTMTTTTTTTTTTHASLSPDESESLAEIIATTSASGSTSTLTTPRLHGSDSTNTTTIAASALSKIERTAVIVGSVAGALILIAFLTCLMWCCRRRPRSHRDEKMPPGWKRISALDRATTLNAPQRRPTTARKHPTLNLAVVPPDWDQSFEDDDKAERPAVMVEVTRHSAEAAGLGAQSMYLTVPAHVTYATRGESRSTSRFLPNDYPYEGGEARSRSDSRVTVGSSRWGWTVPITPLFNLVMSRRSSAGSGRFVSPGGALETPRPDVLAFPERPRVSSDASAASTNMRFPAGTGPGPDVDMDMDMRACTRSGDLARSTREGLSMYERDRFEVHSLSDFPWAGIASRAPSQTFPRFPSNLDVSSDRSAPVLDALPEIPGEGSGSETETEAVASRRPQGHAPQGMCVV